MSPLNIRRTPGGGAELTGSLVILDSMEAVLEFMVETSHNTSKVFPEDSNEVVTFTAGGGNNTFGAWAEVVDNNAVALASKFTSSGHITGLLVEYTDTDDNVYVVEIAYGDAKVPIVTIRFRSGTKFIGLVQPSCFVSIDIPVGEALYYRMKCETGGAVAEVHFRYILHS